MHHNILKASNDTTIIDARIAENTIYCGVISAAPFTRSPCEFYCDGMTIVAILPESLDYQPVWNTEIETSLNILNIK